MEEGSISVNFDKLFAMMDHLVHDQKNHKADVVNRIEQFEKTVTERLDKLEFRVVGDGDERAITIRLRDVEREQQRRVTLDLPGRVLVIEQTMFGWHTSWKVVAAIGAAVWAASLVIMGIVLSVLLQ